MVNRGFEPWSGQTKDCKIGMCCFSDKHAALRIKSSDWLARKQNSVSKLWNDKPIAQDNFLTKIMLVTNIIFVIITHVKTGF